MPPQSRPPQATGPTPPRSVELLTMLWMLSVVTTLACEIMLFSARLYLNQLDPQNVMLGAFVSLLMFSALVLGTTSLILGGLTYWLRVVKPPMGVLVFALLVGALPWGIGLWNVWRGPV